MSEEHESDIRPSTAEERRAREAVRELPEPRPRAAFRDRLRVDFTRGTIAPAPEPRRGFFGLRPRWVFATLAPVAAVVLAVVLVRANRGPHWELEGVRGPGTVVLDGEALPASDAEAIAARIRSGARLELRGETELELFSCGNLALQVTPNTVLTVPGVPGRWFGRTVDADVAMGEVRIVTGPEFEGDALLVRTPEADVKVTGTTFAVIRDSTATCVCAYEGSVWMGEPGAPMEEIPTGMRRFLYNDGRAPELVEIDAQENMKLQMFQEQTAPMFGPRP